MSIFDLFKRIEKNNKNSAPITHIIVGLGNPGEKYVFTRHNAGFMAMDYLCEHLKVKCNKLKFKALTCDTEIANKHVLLMKPQTFMNNSGEAISQAASFYKVPVENIIVLFDDISLPIGKIRIRRKGSSGGHNGIKSIITYLNSDEFPRIKFGVGQKPTPEYDLVSWVLEKIPENDRSSFFDSISNCPDIVSLLLNDEFDAAMCKYN